MEQIASTIETIGYFMKLEDKYWGLFLISLLVLILVYSQKEKHFWRYGVLAYVILICPLTVYGLIKIFPDLQIYYPIRWLSQSLIFICFVITTGVTWLLKDGQKRKAVIFFGLCVLVLGLAGTPVFFAGNARANHASGLEKGYADSYELLINDMAKREKEKAYIWGSSDWMAQGRIVSADFYPVYGKVTGEENVFYRTEPAQDSFSELRQFYDYYEAMDSPLINKDQQLEALAGALGGADLPENCYVAVFNSNTRWVNQLPEAAEIDVIGIFAELGYEYIGETDNLYIFMWAKK